MTLERFQAIVAALNATQIVGIAAFLAAATACFLVKRSNWTILGFLLVLGVMEVMLGFRHELGGGIERQLYEDRAAPQLFAVLAILLLAGVALSGLRRKTGTFSDGAFVWVIALAGLFAIETISLHSLDTILYQPIAGVRIIGWLWALLSIAIFISARRA